MGTDPVFLICIRFANEKNRVRPQLESGAFDHLELVIDVAYAVDLTGELRGAAALGIARDGAP